MELDQLLAHLCDHSHFLNQQRVELFDVVLDVGVGLVHLLQQLHVFLDDVNDAVHVGSVHLDNLLLFLQDSLDQRLVVLANVAHDVARVPVVSLELLDLAHADLAYRSQLLRQKLLLGLQGSEVRCVHVEGSHGLPLRLLDVLGGGVVGGLV